MEQEETAERPRVPGPGQQVQKQHEQQEDPPQQLGEAGQQKWQDEEHKQQEQTPDREAPGVAPSASGGQDGARREGLPLRPPPGPQGGHEGDGEEEEDLPQFSDLSEESDQGGGRGPAGPVLHVVYHFEDGAIRVDARDEPLSFEEQGRLDVKGLGAIGVANVPFVLRTKYGQDAMYFGPRQRADELAVSGQSGKGSAAGTGSGTFDWELLPSPAGSRTDESKPDPPLKGAGDAWLAFCGAC